jgi:vacuolar-type H+-ATPase subunit F/Vma7
MPPKAKKQTDRINILQTHYHMIRKRVKKIRNIRSVDTNDDDNDGNNNEAQQVYKQSNKEEENNNQRIEQQTQREQDLSIILAATKLKQKIRQKKGLYVDTDSLKAATIIGNNNKSQYSSSKYTPSLASNNISHGGTRGGLVHPSEIKNEFQKIEDKIQSEMGDSNLNVKSMNKFAMRAKSETEKKMEEYVEMEMKKRGFMTKEEKEKLLRESARFISRDDSENNNINSNMESNTSKIPTINIDELYQIPEHLRVSRSLIIDDNNIDQSNKYSTAATESESLNEQDIAEQQQLMTGSILEVKLPVEYKIKNIEETEQATKKIRTPSSYTTIVTSGTNVLLPTRQSKKHLSEFNHNIQEEIAMKELGKYIDVAGNDMEHSGNKKEKKKKRSYPTASDEATYENFVKRYRRIH